MSFRDSSEPGYKILGKMHDDFFLPDEKSLLFYALLFTTLRGALKNQAIEKTKN